MAGEFWSGGESIIFGDGWLLYLGVELWLVDLGVGKKLYSHSRIPHITKLACLVDAFVFVPYTWARLFLWLIKFGFVIKKEKLYGATSSFCPSRKSLCKLQQDFKGRPGCCLWRKCTMGWERLFGQIEFEGFYGGIFNFWHHTWHVEWCLEKKMFPDWKILVLVFWYTLCAL